MTFEKLKLLLWLFKTDFFISSFTFGGGYVVLPMIRKYFIEQKHLFSEDELMDMSAVAQSSPGDRKSTRLNSSHWNKSRMPSSA